jgi:hypothetical protein
LSKSLIITVLGVKFGHKGILKSTSVESLKIFLEFTTVLGGTQNSLIDLLFVKSRSTEITYLFRVYYYYHTNI